MTLNEVIKYIDDRMYELLLEIEKNIDDKSKKKEYAFLSTVRYELSQIEILKVQKERAIKAVEGVLNDVERIRRSELIVDGDLDEALGDLCSSRCSNYGKNCFKHGKEPYSCANFKWIGA